MDKITSVVQSDEYPMEGECLFEVLAVLSLCNAMDT